MTKVTIDEAAAKLQTLVKEVMDGNEVLITKDDQPVARLISVRARARSMAPSRGWRRRAGSALSMWTTAANPTS